MKRCHVGGEDRAERAREAALGGGPQRAAEPHLVLQPLEVHDVGVDGHADRHDDAGDTGEGQREPATRRATPMIAQSSAPEMQRPAGTTRPEPGSR